MKINTCPEARHVRTQWTALIFVIFSAFSTAHAVQMCPDECPSGPIRNSQFEAIGCVMKTSTIGPKNDFIPIEDAMKPCPPNPDPHLACGMNAEQIASILNAGMRFECPVADGGKLNAWALDDGTGDSDRVYTNGHAIAGAESKKILSDFKPCGVRPFSNLSDDLHLINPSDTVLGSWVPLGDKSAKDRARMGLKDKIAGLVPLKFDPAKAKAIGKNDKLYMISLEPPKMERVVIQACNALKPPTLIGPDVPAIIGTDCDNYPGNSAALYIHPKFNGSREVVNFDPVAIHRGGVEKVGDNKNWDLKTNTGVAIILDENFNKNLVSK